jgi:hypothetical protein
VKSIRNLLFVLWGLSWVIVPLLVHKLGLRGDTIPLVMFGALASIFIVTWHKGAVLRALLRGTVGAPSTGVARADADAATPVARPALRVAPAPARARVDVGEAGKVRVHAGELAPEELLGQTELPARASRATRSAER